MKQRFFLIHACAVVSVLTFAPRCRAASGAPDALIEAVEAGDLGQVQKLLKAGADPDSRNKKGVPALVLAASGKNAAIVEALLGKGADVHAKTNTEQMSEIPVVWAAATNGSAETLRLILRAGANPNARDSSRVTPLMAAAYLGNSDTIPVLIEAKADLEAQDLENQTALMWAANGGRYEAVRLLLDAGAQVDALGEQKATPLMYAAQHGYDDVAALLIERGADLNRKAAPGLTALDLAKQNNRMLTVSLLENGGRQAPAVSEFLTFRSLLYPEYPMEAVLFNEVSEEKRLETVRQLANEGELQRARDMLEAGLEESQGQPGYWWALAYLRRQVGDRAAALAALRKILATPNRESRETLRAWRLMRELGEAPPPDLSTRVLGVVVETGLGPHVLVIAAYADGQPRYFLSAGGGVIGESWTDDVTQKTQEIVRLAQELMGDMPVTEDKELPKPGRVRFIFLTPGGSYGAEESFAFLNQSQGRYAKIFAASDQLVGMLNKLSEAEQDKTP